VKHVETFSDSLCAELLSLAERELSAFIAVVTDLFGPEQARISAEDWLDEYERMDGRLQSASREWRTITIAASTRLASRVEACTQ
jgi:alkylhydroperoxidase/carboxymuconolactone decarboxylase family protein YurZ